MNNSIKRIISCCLVIVLLNSIVGCGRSNVTDESINGEQFAFTMIDKISDCSETIFNPLMQEPSYIDSKLSIQDNGLDYTNYWVQTIIAITKMYKEGDYEYAKNVIAREMHTFDEYGYFPRPEYTVFPYGWVSSMDAPVIAVASQMLYEHTGETIYVDFVDRLSNYILQDTKHHGFYCDVSDGIWMFEYANHDTSEDNAEFVLNGSLFGTLCTLLIADVTNNQKLKSLISNQVRIYKQYAPQYLYENGEWCYYMLHEKRVDPPHYIIYEIRLYDALYELSNDHFFNTQAQVRRDILLNYYKLYYDKGEDNNYCFKWLRAGAPHYYNIDIFDTKLCLYDRKHNVLDELVFDKEKPVEIWQSDVLPTKAEWSVVTDYYEVKIGTVEIIRNKKSAIDNYLLTPSIGIVGDGELREKTIDIRNGNNKCNINFLFENDIQFSPENIFVLELNNKTDNEYVTNVSMSDSEGVGISRYLPTLQKGKCFFAFGTPGFVENSSQLENIHEIDICIYTGEMREGEIEVNNLYMFSDAGQYMKYLEDTQYEMCWEDG